MARPCERPAGVGSAGGRSRVGRLIELRSRVRMRSPSQRPSERAAPQVSLPERCAALRGLFGAYYVIIECGVARRRSAGNPTAARSQRISAKSALRCVALLCARARAHLSTATDSPERSEWSAHLHRAQAQAQAQAAPAPIVCACVCLRAANKSLLVAMGIFIALYLFGELRPFVGAARRCSCAKTKRGAKFKLCAAAAAR